MTALESPLMEPAAGHLTGTVLDPDGVPIPDFAAAVGLSRRHLYKWVQRFLQDGLAGLADKPGRGARRVPRQHPVTEQQNESA